LPLSIDRIVTIHQIYPTKGAKFEGQYPSPTGFQEITWALRVYDVFTRKSRLPCIHDDTALFDI